ncbi:MAG: Ig domain-containing protein, partial [Calditrichaeota bacterium]
MKRMFLLLGLSALMLTLYLACEGPEGPPGEQGASAPYIILEPSTLKLMVGETATLNATTSDRQENYTWESSDEAVVTVDASGVLTGVSPGLAVVTARGVDSKASAFATVTVTEALASEISFSQHILPMFTTNNFWFPGSDKCTSCHFSNNEDEGSKHAMDLGSYQGHMLGADPPDQSTPGHPLYGQTPGQTDFDWDNSLLRARLRNNRMPQQPGWEFRRDESNRNGPDLELVNGHWQVKKPHQYTSWGNEDNVPNALGLIQAWVEALKAGGDIQDSTLYFSYMGADSLTFFDDVQQFFIEGDTWFPNSQPCVECHFANNEFSYHEMNLGTFAGIILGA